MKDPKMTDFNSKQITGWTFAKFEKWWKLHGFDGNVKEWYEKITKKPKAK